MRKSVGFRPLMYCPLLSVTWKLSTTMSTLTRKMGAARPGRAAKPAAPAGGHSEEILVAKSSCRLPVVDYCKRLPSVRLPSARALRRARRRPPGAATSAGAGQSSRCEAKICSTSLLGPLRNAHVQLRRARRCISSASAAQYSVFDSQLSAMMRLE